MMTVETGEGLRDSASRTGEPSADTVVAVVLGRFPVGSSEPVVVTDGESESTGVDGSSSAAFRFSPAVFDEASVDTLRVALPRSSVMATAAMIAIRSSDSGFSSVDGDSVFSFATTARGLSKALGGKGGGDDTTFAYRGT